MGHDTLLDMATRRSIVRGDSVRRTPIAMNASNPFPCVKSSRAAILWLAAFISGTVPSLASTASPVLNYSTFIGGGGTTYSGEIGTGIAIGPGGFVYFVGITTSGDTFPYTHSFGNPNDTLGSFVGKYNPADHTLAYLTFIPGCVGRGIAVDGLGNAYLTGECYALPATNAVQPDFGGGYYDAFAVKLNPDGTQLLYATFLGGANVDMGRRIAVNNAGEAIITGFTASTNFPTRAALQSQLAGSYDAFLVKLDASGSNFVYATYLGGASGDFGYGLALDTFGDIYISGWSYSDSFSAGPLPV